MDGNISKIHTLSKSNCNIINLHLEINYNFDRNNKYKYYNPNLIRNNGQMKKYQPLHCDFPKSSIISFPNNSKNNNQINVETVVISPTRKRRKKNNQNNVETAVISPKRKCRSSKK